MGGIVALTIRTSETECYRGSCWTNVLTEGLFAADFYRDLDTSRDHAKTWLAQLLAHRTREPDLAKLWGSHNLLAPIEYGIVIVDYVTSTLVSAQSYTDVATVYTFKDDPPDEKHAALDAAGLLTLVPAMKTPASMIFWRITLPFAHVQNGEQEALVTPALLAWCETNFGLSEAERVAWDAWFAERDA